MSYNKLVVSLITVFLILLFIFVFTSCITTTTTIKGTDGQVVEIHQSKNSTITVERTKDTETIISEQRNPGILESFGLVVINNAKSIMDSIAGIFRPAVDTDL
jgi:hypothetical protein